VSRDSGSELGTVKITNISIGGKSGFVGIELDYPSGCLYNLVSHC